MYAVLPLFWWILESGEGYLYLDVLIELLLDILNGHQWQFPSIYVWELALINDF